MSETKEAEAKSEATAQILALKAEIFDFLEAPERLRNQIAQIEQMKQERVAKLNQIRTG